MSYSLALDSDGDLKGSGSRYAIVAGTDKLKQDLDIWFREKFSIDRFHPNYGSTLDGYIGTIVSPLSISEIKQEASRVMANYQKLQRAEFDKDVSKFTLDELVVSVSRIDVSQYLDSISVVIFFNTAAGSSVAFNVGVRI